MWPSSTISESYIFARKILGGGELEFQKLLFHRIIISRSVLRETNSVIEASHCINLKTKYFWIVRKG